MRKILLLFGTLLLLLGCKKEYEAPVPDLKWDLFDSPNAVPLSASVRTAMEGVYTIVEGGDMFGGETVLKWSYVAENGDTTYYMSGFCEKDVAYFICEGKRLDSMLLFNGYWRKMVNTETGKVRFTISTNLGSRKLMSASPIIVKGSLRIQGVFGEGNDQPLRHVALDYNRPMHRDTSFTILAHRCGGRTSDLLPVSENSVKMVKMASHFGATGVEMDVRLTSDAVPVIYHDETLNDRLTELNGMEGLLSNYSYTQLYDLVRLKDGERIPTLREILDAVVYSTPLQVVWLDIKYNGSLQQIRDMQIEYEQKAQAVNRKLKILIGIPDEDVQNNFLALPDFNSAKCINEMYGGIEKVNAYAWGARWTLGTQDAEVQHMHSEGRKAYVWTIDEPQFIKQFINETHFDGILSNYPSIVAYYYYAKQ